MRVAVGGCCHRVVVPLQDADTAVVVVVIVDVPRQRWPYMGAILIDTVGRSWHGVVGQ